VRSAEGTGKTPPVFPPYKSLNRYPETARGYLAV